ncbi:DNAint/rec [Tomelloso virus]|uniref:DNAint/rec n=1 Tax=Tomelloso virus TaxID=2053981 RepID=A0A2H4T2R1_9VIRU|nr:DNAint/rec [Tomelloso virus]ATY70206.1 DNAint/rec [Tomelloso virus]
MPKCQLNKKSNALATFLSAPYEKPVEPITIRKPHTVSELRQLNEAKLTALLPSLPLEDVIRKTLPTPSKHREPIKSVSESINELPKTLVNAIKSLKLLEEPNMENRAAFFIGYCKYKNYNYNTTNRYFTILRRTNVFGDDPKLRPNKLAFIDNGKQHERIVSMADFRTFAIYLQENLTKLNAPIAIALFTGLRTSEILQFSTYTLYQLHEKKIPVAIKRKQTVVSAVSSEPIYWEPIYNTHLNAFVDRLINDIYSTDYQLFIETTINTKLFRVTPKTLGNRIKALYYDAVGKLAPLGFGVHSCRNMIAMLMAEKSENIMAIQSFLQHKNIKTTRQYIRSDYTYTTSEFNRLTQYEFNDTFEKLIPK